MLKDILILCGLIFSFSTLQISAQPKLPYKDFGACPFECCVYGKWRAIEETKIFKRMDESSPVYFKIGKGEHVFGLTGVVITEKAGIVKAIKNTTIDFYNEKSKKTFRTKVRKDENIYLLTYQGEGFYAAWYKNKIYSLEVTQDFKEISEPESIWWVKIKNRRGKIGWTKKNDNFDGKDKCA